MSNTVIYDEGFVAAAPAGSRRLGNDLARPRNLYILYMPLFMLSFGLLCWVAPTDLTLIIGALALSVVAIYMFLDLVIWEGALRVSTILVTVLALGYGVGAANTWLTTPRAADVSLGEFLHVDPAELAHTMGSVLIAMAIVLSIGEMVEKPIFGKDFELELPTQAIFFLGVGVLIIIAAYLRGSLNYMGASNGGGGAEGIFPAFSFWLIGTLLAITLVAALNAKSKFIRRYLMLLTVIQFVLEVPIGRRNLIFNVVLAFMVIRLGRFRFNWSWPKRIVIGAIMAVLLYFGSIGFFYLRVAGYSIHGKANILQRISLAVTYFETRDYEEVKKSFSNNLQQRTFILGFLADLETLSGNYAPGYGQNLAMQLGASIPSAIYPSKNTITEEALANQLFGSTFGDQANSILTGGVVDFGFMGMILYPLIIVFMIRAFFELVGKMLPQFVATFIIVAGIGALLQPETGLTAYFLIFRNSILFGAVVWFFLALPALRLRRD